MKDYYRPLRITHGSFGYQISDPYAQKVACVEKRVKELKQKGFGGIVTNISFEDHYLHSKDEWKLMLEKVRICRENGMRMWLYDEKGYPSGAAGVETLKANPDYEARALALEAKILAPGESWHAVLPRGHEKILGAVSYRMAGTRITEQELGTPHYETIYNETVDFANTADENLLCLLFCEKRMYEGAHCEHNVFSSRRYIDVSNRDAVAEFINNTYRRYTDLLGKNYAKYIGDENPEAVIEAIFTDEPSYMGVYINAELYPQDVDHPFDDTLPLYPIVNWGRDVANRFACVNGYRLEPELTALFFGHGEHFCRVRLDYHRVMSQLYEESFFSQLSNYCASVGLNFSGHILLEDELPLHVKFEGNFFKLLRHMHIPGIDMLTSIPQEVWDFAFTPKMVSSIALLNGREHVMDEVSAHFQGGKVSLQQVYVSLLLQFAFGADVFTSYYADDFYDENDQRKLLDAITYAERELAGAKLRDTLLYYPIETMMRNRKPEQEFLEQDSDSEQKITVCNAAMMKALNAMLNHQKDFVLTDTDSLDILPPDTYRYFVIGACDITDELVIRIQRLAKEGCRVVYFCEDALFLPQFEKITEYATCVSNVEGLMAVLCPNGFTLENGVPGVAALETASRLLLVNRDEQPKKLVLNRSVQAVTDVMTCATVPFEAGEGKATFTLPGCAGVVVAKA